MKKATVVLLLLFSAQLFALNKSDFDIITSPNELAKTGSSMSGFYGSRELSNSYTSYSMMTGGYFTLGTTNGLADSPFDDRCDLTFGHPYALTSFPVIAIDGTWGRPDQFISNQTDLIPQQSGMMLSLEAAIDNVGFTFQMNKLDDGRAVELSLTLSNNDVIDHSLGLGLVIDPALGQWGDGTLDINGAAIEKSGILADENLSTLLLQERATPTRGLRAQFELEQPADQVVVANWPDIYHAAFGELGDTGSQLLYDLCLKFIWQSRVVAPQSEFSSTVVIRLLAPEFSQKAFMRWDMPSAFSMQDNLLFPRRLNTAVRVMNSTGSPQNNFTIEVTHPDELSGDEAVSSFSIPKDGSAYPILSVQSKEIYEDIVVPLQITCRQDGQVVDQLTRNVFVPATPVSDEGLLVSVDSTWTTTSNLNLIFNVEKEETGQRLLNLAKENILLYDNEGRVRDFNMEKFGQGGSDLADVCFVLDCSGSMGDNINAVRTHLGEFADSLLARGFDYQIGIVTFSTTVDDVWDFSNDIELLKDRLASIGLWGGIEDSPSALYRASTLSWRDGAKRNIIWITDENYPEEIYTKQQVVDRMLAMDIRVHGIGLLELQTDWFNPIVLPTGGTFYNIFGNFRDILLDVARMKSQDQYHISFSPTSPDEETHNIRLKVHYAGLGGETTVAINAGEGLGKKLACYPNPFNPIVRIQVDASQVHDGRVEIFDVLGRRVRLFNITPLTNMELVWDARDDFGAKVSSGFYIVRLSTRLANGANSSESQKVLYLK
jgi:hypothetical protein